MPVYHETVTKEAVSQAELEVVLPPRDLGTLPKRTLTFSCAGDFALAEAKVQVGPTEAGPWVDEDLTGTGIPTLAPGSADACRMDKADRWVQVLAKGATGEGQTDLTIYLDAIG